MKERKILNWLSLRECVVGANTCKSSMQYTLWSGFFERQVFSVQVGKYGFSRYREKVIRPV